ncbi:hypothetical protein ACFJIX_13340 [Roseateles sp. UC29_93]|uniref:hypothetical protein n=1 Tax=Roseateles sp. UC29_93 TaxID=3350177 RepID=UPI00366DA62F
MATSKKTKRVQDQIQENAFKGQSRTETHLADFFWLLSRSIDINGEDLLVERRRDSSSIPAAAGDPQCFGLIQAKFFQGKNLVKILRSYVEDMTGPRTNFFAFLHSDDADGEHIHYFFTAQEIIESWKVSRCQEFFEFRITKTRLFERFLNRPRHTITNAIQTGISRTQGLQSRYALSRFFRTHVDRLRRGRRHTDHHPMSQEMNNRRLPLEFEQFHSAMAHPDYLWQEARTIYELPCGRRCYDV